MRNRQAPKSKKSDIWEKSKKDLHVYKGNMNTNNRRYSVPTTNVDGYVKSRQVNVQPVKMLAKSGSKSRHQLASSSLGDTKKKSVMSMKHVHISKNQKNSATLSSKGDSNEVWYSKKSQTLNMRGGMVQRSNGIENSVPTPLKPIARLVPNETTINTCPLSRKMGQSKVSQGDVVIGKSDSYENLELAESNHKKVGIVKVISPNLASSSLDGNQFLQEPKGNLGNQSSLDGNQFLQEPKGNLGNRYLRMFGMDLSNCEQGKASCMTDNNSAILPHMAHLCDSNGHTNKGKYNRWREPLVEGKPQTSDDNHVDGVVQLDNQICRPLKKTRRLLVAIEDKDGDEDEQIEDRYCDRSHMGVCKYDSQAKVPVSSYVQQHSYCCSKPIDEPVWSGIFKINGKEYMSLAGHLSTKSGKKACEFSKSLTPIIHMTKISRLEVWPKGWEALKTDDNNIGLYFFPHKTRVVDKELDQLVNELIENDLALRAVINEVEILIFTSTLLPQRYQTFQTKHYLWCVFRHKKDKGVVVEDALTTTTYCAKVVEKEAQQTPKILDKVQWEELGQEMILSNNYMALEKQNCLNKSTQDDKATGVQEPHSMDFESRATQEVGQGDTLCRTMRTAEVNTIATGGTSTISTSMMYGFVVPQTPRFEQLIREMEREGAVVWKGIR